MKTRTNAPRSRRDRDEEDEEEEDDEDRRRPAARDRDDEDEDEEDRPRRRAADEEDEDEQDRSRARVVVDDDGQVVTRRRSDDEDEEDDYDDRPRGGRGKSGSKKGLLLVVGLLAFLLLGAGGSAAVYFLWLKDSPTTEVVSNNPPGDEDVPAVPNPVVPKGNDPAVKGPDKKGPAPKAPNVWQPPPRALAIAPVKFTGDRKTVSLPGPVSDVCAGGDGRYLFIHCPDDKKLLVFDVSSAEVVKELPTGGKEARFAAGATKLLFFDAIVRTLQRFDLVSLEKEKEEPLALPGTIRDIALGSGSRGPALVLTDAPADAWPVHFVDLDTLAAADVGWAASPPAGLPRDLRFRASANGSRWVGLPEGKDAKGGVVVARDGKALTVTPLKTDKPLGFAALSPDGNTLYCRLGSFPLRMTPPANLPADTDSYSLPAVTGSFDIRVQPAEAPETVQVTVGRRAKGSVPKTVSGVPQPFKPDEPARSDRLVHFVPDAHALFVLQPARKRLEVVRLDPFTPGTKSAVVTSTPPDRFTPGKPLEYPVRVLTNASQVTFAVSGPTGVGIGPDGVVRWAVPADEGRDQLSFQVTVIADGARGTQTVKTYNTDAPAPKGVELKKGPEPKKEPPKSPDPKGPAIAAGVKLVQPAKDKVPIPPAEMASAHVEVPLPGQARDVCVGGGGRYLIFHVPTARKLVVFDTSTLKVARTLAVTTDDLLFAAGMDRLVVVYPAEKTIVRYALATLKYEADAALETPQRPTFAAMGSGTAGPLILGGVPSQKNASRMALTFLDLETFKEVKIDKAEGDFQVTTAAAAHLRVSADGRTLGLWRAELLPSGVQIARLAGNTIQGSYRADSAGEVTPGPDGQKVYTEQGVYHLDARPEDSRTPVVPAVEGAGHLSVSGPPAGKRTVAVWGSAADKPLATFDDLPGFNGQRDPFQRDNPNLALDHRLFWVPSARVLIVVPPAADRLHVYAVGAK